MRLRYCTGKQRQPVGHRYRDRVLAAVGGHAFPALRSLTDHLGFELCEVVEMLECLDIESGSTAITQRAARAYSTSWPPPAPTAITVLPARS